MNNVWISIAFRAPCSCVVSAGRARPLLSLLNGLHYYGISQHAGYVAARVARNLPVVRQPCAYNVLGFRQNRRALISTSSVLQAKRVKARRGNSVSSNTTHPAAAPKLEKAPVIASHSEGAPLNDDEVSRKPTEELTWRDYAPEGGMPLFERDLELPELEQIFGVGNITPEEGNYVLNVMNWRRQSGALIDMGVELPLGSDISQDTALRALQYIRAADRHFDEQAAGQVWAEEETLRMYEQIQDRSVKLGLYKRDTEQSEDDEQMQGTPQGRARTEQSTLEAMRVENEAAWEMEQAARKEKEKKDQLALLRTKRGPLELAGGLQPTVKYTIGSEGGIMVTPANTKAELDQQRALSWRQYHAEQAQIIKDNVIPSLSSYQRLAPSLFVTLITVALCLYLSDSYTPAPTSARIFPDIPPAVATIGAITALNIIVFIACRWPPFYRFSNKYLQVSPAYPFAMSMLGSCWRHDTLFHLANNLIALWLFGPMLHNDVGRGSFIAIYIGAGALGGYISLVGDVLLRRNFATYGIGASGCTMGALAAACVVRPSGTVTIFGYEIPMAAWVFLALTGLNEGVAIWRGVSYGINHVAHLGGLVSGGVGAMYLRMKAQRDTALHDGSLMAEVKRVTDGVGVKT
nr:presenilins-associated rhomboid-like protein, mitochondrial [Quercus suber]